MSSFEDLRFASNSCKILQLEPKGGYTNIIFQIYIYCVRGERLQVNAPV